MSSVRRLGGGGGNEQRFEVSGEVEGVGVVSRGL